MGSMALGLGSSYGKYPCMDGSFVKRRDNIQMGKKRVVLVRAESGETINPEIRKSEAKVVDSVLVTELAKPLTAYCRCWRSGTFPLCDGAHVKHNKATGDNVGPLLLKNQ